MAPFHLIRSIYKGQYFIHETDLDGTTREQLVDQLAQGQFDTGVIDGVILVDPDAGTTRDVSGEVAHALSDLSFRRSDTLSGSAADFVEAHGLDSYRPACFRPDHERNHPDQEAVWYHAA